jgi:hypothetical protein
MVVRLFEIDHASADVLPGMTPAATREYPLGGAARLRRERADGQELLQVTIACRRMLHTHGDAPLAHEKTHTDR